MILSGFIRTSLLGPLLLAGSSAQLPKIEAWEKPILPGLVYRMEVEKDPARTIHILRYSRKAGVVTMAPALAGKTVYEPSRPGTPDTKGRSTVSQIARESDAIAVVNADYFPYTGDPLGLMVRDGDLISIPHAKRAAFAWGPNETLVNRSAFFATVHSGSQRLFSIDALNEECPQNRIALNLPVAGRALGKIPSMMAILKLDAEKLPPSTEITATVTGVLSGQDSLQIPAGQAVLVGQGERAATIGALEPGQKLTIRMETSGFSWERFDGAIGGGPRLLRNGDIEIPTNEEGFGDDHAENRHPRTAVGSTRSGDIVLVVVDGRQSQSVGATLIELAGIMRRQGCVEALNLDGGGSSAMNLLGLTMNKPSDAAGERPVANALILRGVRPAVSKGALKIRVPARVAAGASIRADVRDAAGKPIPNADVLWSLSGPAWVDGGGTVHALNAGTATLRAYTRGQILSANIEVNGKKK